MQPLRYSINTTLDGCVHHAAGLPGEDTHRFAETRLARADALILGRITYTMMEEVWRAPVETGEKPEWFQDWMMPFARTIHAARKYVVSDTLERVTWNAELVRGVDLEKTVRRLKAEPGRGLYVGGVKLPLALAELGLIDEYEFLVHPVIAGHGPSLLGGLSKGVVMKLVGREEYASGAVALRYEPSR